MPVRTEIAAGVNIIDAAFGGPSFTVPLEIPLLRGERNVLIDSGVATTPAQHVQPYLAQLGLSTTDLDLVALTHAHQDHFGGNAALKAAHPELRFAIHQNDMAWAEDHLRHWNQMYLIYPGQWEPDEQYKRAVLDACGDNCAIDIPLTAGDHIEVGRGLDLEVILAPAHSPGHVVFFNRQHDVLFAGDALQGRGVSVNGAADIMPLYIDVDVYRQTLQTIAELEAEIVCTAHSGVLRGGAIHQVLRECTEFIEEFDGAVEAALNRAKRPLALAEVADAVHGQYSAYEKLYQIHALCHTHLQKMVADGRAHGMIINEAKHWSAS